MLAPVKSDEGGKLSVPLAEDLDTYAEQNYRKSVESLVLMLEYCAEHGPDKLPPKWGHVLDKKHGIAEFIKGDLRILYFKANDGAVVVCSHVFLKKSQKTPKSEIKRAVRAKDEYELAAKRGQLKVYKKE